MFGISAALVTPLNADGAVDVARLRAHARTVLCEGCTSVTLFGTTGEGASVASEARLASLRALIDAPTDPAALVMTLHGAAAGDVADQAAAALAMGVKRFLVPPPSYYNARFILYHIPQVVGVGLSTDLVARLRTAFPDQVLGVKDSSGSFDNTRKLLQLDGLEILVGDERRLAACARLGASGAISGIANLFAGRLARVLADGVDDAAINRLVDAVVKHPVTPAIKSLVAHRYGAHAWRRTLPPLEAVSDAEHAALARAFDALGATA